MTAHTRLALLSTFIIALLASTTPASAQTLSYKIVDTGQTHCFSESTVIVCGSAYNGQDAQYAGAQPSYQANNDGTVTDLNTGLMWITDPDDKVTYAEATELLATYNYAGYTDWRLPSIKELYSLTLFSGFDPSGEASVDSLIPFIDVDAFAFEYGDESSGERLIDSQWLTSTIYNDTVMNNQSCFFGFNFADGRIKCYPLETRGNGYFALFVRGESAYGQNEFVDNLDGTVTDIATGLTWMQADNGIGVNWGEALAYCEALTLNGMDDWRLPNIKELQSIVDYSRSPDGTDSAAIDPLFSTSRITNEAGQSDYPHFWSSTTHIGGMDPASAAAYIAFGRALGNMDNLGWVDVHGAGAQRSDPKLMVPADQTNGFGPQGDARRVDNYVRCVQGGDVVLVEGDDPSTLTLPTVAGPPSSPPDQGQSAQPPGQSNTGQPPNQGQPPQAAIDACMSLAEGASCTIWTPNGSNIDGVCRPLDSTLACTPNP